MELTGLEKKVVERLAMKFNQNDRDNVKMQIDHARATHRRNTGAGFFTTLNVTNIDVTVKEQIVGGVFGMVTGLINPMTFCLICRDGVIHTLEGASIDENTLSINFDLASVELME